MGILYLVSTPIGNLEDITLRAVRILASVDFIICEDTRKTGLLFKHLNTSETNYKEKSPRLISYYEENEIRRIPQIIKLLEEGRSGALVSNAGTPLISDPGFKLIRECIKNDLKVVSIPGASASLAALVCSGLPTDKFLFLGYLPKKTGKREKLLKKLLKNFSTMNRFIEPTIIIYESPYRLVKTLGNIQEVFGDIEIVVCRELTKVHEEIRREKISAALTHFTKTKPRGEFTLVFHQG